MKNKELHAFSLLRNRREYQWQRLHTKFIIPVFKLCYPGHNSDEFNQRIKSYIRRPHKKGSSQKALNERHIKFMQVYATGKAG